MKNTTSRKFTLLMLGLFGLAMMNLTGCAPDEPAPDIPPESSLVMDFADWQDGNRLSGTDSTGTWGHAATHVAVWNVVIAVNLAVPVLAYGNAFNFDPKWKNRHDAWVWAYDFNLLGIKIDAELHGAVDAGGINWKMYLSAAGGYQDFLWFEGNSAADRKSGTWRLYRAADNPVPYLDVAWNNDLAGTADIRYTNVQPNNGDNGSYIEYRMTNDTDYDRFYDINLVSQSNLVEIKWNHTNQNGRVKNPNHFSDSDWHCWDGLHIDTVCQ